MTRKQQWMERLQPRLPKSKREILDLMAYCLFGAAALILVVPFFLVLVDVVVKGLPGLSPSFFLETAYDLGRGGGVRNAIVGTLELVGIASSVALPLSIGAAVYTTEYAQGGRVQQAVEFTADVLAGIPSIVFGAFGYIFFVWVLRLGTSLLAGALTLALMMIPTVLRTTQESLRAVPQTLREASLALGATRWTTTWRVTLRACLPGVMTGVLLAIGRVAGETAPLLFTAGYNFDSPWSLLDAAASLPFTIYSFIIHYDPLLNQKAYSTALVLILIVMAIDLAANWASRRVGGLIR